MLLLLDDEEENVADAIDDANKERTFRRAWCASIFFSFFFSFVSCEVICLFVKTEERKPKREGRRGASREQFFTTTNIHV